MSNIERAFRGDPDLALQRSSSKALTVLDHAVRALFRQTGGQPWGGLNKPTVALNNPLKAAFAVYVEQLVEAHALHAIQVINRSVTTLSLDDFAIMQVALEYSHLRKVAEAGIRHIIAGHPSQQKQMPHSRENNEVLGMLLNPVVFDAEEQLAMRVKVLIEKLANEQITRQTTGVINESTQTPDSLGRPKTKPKGQKKPNGTSRVKSHEKLIPALIKHHDYSNGSVGNWEPIVLRELHRLTKVGLGTISRFFNDQFAGNQKGVSGFEMYSAACRSNDRSKLIESLKAMNGEYTPHRVLEYRDELFDDLKRQAKTLIASNED